MLLIYVLRRTLLWVDYYVLRFGFSGVCRFGNCFGLFTFIYCLHCMVLFDRFCFVDNAAYSCSLVFVVLIALLGGLIAYYCCLFVVCAWIGVEC